MKLQIETLTHLCCPKCMGGLTQIDKQMYCSKSSCGQQYPIVDDIPVLLDENRSLFTVDDFLEHRQTFQELAPKTMLKKMYKFILLLNSHNIKATRNYRKLAENLLEQSENPTVLVLGGSVLGGGIKELLKHSRINLIESDVMFGPRTQLICDAHGLPFKDNSVDAVISQAVLEHVADPNQCVSEIHRILKPEGLVYAETPFLQPVHGRPYDFTRYTDLGHRRLFRAFEGIETGIVGGPGMSLALAHQNFIACFFNNKKLKSLALAFGSLTGFWLKYFDYFFSNRPNGRDMACGYFFFGKKKEGFLLDDKELIGRLYP